MITGYNTDINFNGKTYHVQTEDRGKENPILETLVYLRGQILDAHRTSYAEHLSGGLGEKALAAMLEAQHKRVIRSIKNGRYDPEGVKPFGHGIISERGLDEVVLEFLETQAAAEKVEIQVDEIGDLRPGWTGALRVTLRTDSLFRPVAGAPVVVVWIPEGSDRTVRLLQGRTDAKGILLGEVTLPDTAARGQVQVKAETPKGEVEAALPLPRPA